MTRALKCPECGYITKTWLMKRIEEATGKPIEEVLKEVRARHPKIKDLAEELGVAICTAQQWLQLFGFSISAGLYGRTESIQYDGDVPPQLLLDLLRLRDCKTCRLRDYRWTESDNRTDFLVAIGDVLAEGFPRHRHRKLTPLEAERFRLHYGLDREIRSLDVVAEIWDVSPKYIRQRVQRVLWKLMCSLCRTRSENDTEGHDHG